MSSAYNSTDKKSEDNCAKLAAALLKQYGLDINHLYTHTHWLNVRDGRNGTIDQLNTMYNRYKMCPAYILPHWASSRKCTVLFECRFCIHNTYSCNKAALPSEKVLGRCEVAAGGVFFLRKCEKSLQSRIFCI